MSRSEGYGTPAHHDLVGGHAILEGGLRAIGVQPGGVLLVHASLSALGRVDGGAEAVVAALLEVLGPGGTLVVPTMTANNRDPSRWHDPPVPEDQWETLRATMPPFDPLATPGWRMGAVSEQVRRRPDARRSAHPQSSFAAVGPAAERVVAGHDLRCHLGEQSPLARLEELDADVLLLGVGFERCSCFHLAEYRRPDPPRCEYSAVTVTTGHWFTYQDVVLDDSDFALLGRDFARRAEVRHGQVAGARSWLFPLRSAVSFAVDWLPRHRPGPADDAAR